MCRSSRRFRRFLHSRTAQPAPAPHPSPAGGSPSASGLEMLVSRMNYPISRTALLLVDPYNDLLSEGGKHWPKIKAVAESVGLIAHLTALVAKVRQLGITLVYVPHRRWREGDYDGWRDPNPSQIAGDRAADFADGTWGGDWRPDLVPQPGDVIIKQHWGQNGFANTDL